MPGRHAMHCKSILHSEHLTLIDENRIEHAVFEGNPHGPSALAGIAQIGRVAALNFSSPSRQLSFLQMLHLGMMTQGNTRPAAVDVIGHHWCCA